MTTRRKIVISFSIATATILAILLSLHGPRPRPELPITIEGAIVKEEADTRKKSPIAGVEVTAEPEVAMADATSEFSGYFKIILPPPIAPVEVLTLRFRHPDYQPADLEVAVGANQLHVVPMTPIHGEAESDLSKAETVIANVLVRSATEITTTENIGTGLKTFQVENTGNVPCDQQGPCSPDGRWKAAIDNALLDAGEHNVFQNARVFCIAGPCPFTRIESDEFSRTARTIKVAMRNWSDTTTFLLQAEVFHTQARNIVRKSYPIIFGRSLNFTLPSSAEGVTLEAELDGSQIVFPLALAPSLSWATCEVKIDENKAKDYRCELKPGYRFR